MRADRSICATPAKRIDPRDQRIAELEAKLAAALQGWDALLDRMRRILGDGE